MPHWPDGWFRACQAAPVQGHELLDSRCDGFVREVLHLATAVARQHRQPHVDAVAVLSALARHPDPRLVRALERLGVQPARLAERSLARVAAAPHEPALVEPTPSWAVRRVLELALREALLAGQRTATAGHVLLALLREPDEPVTALLGEPLPELETGAGG